MNQVEVKVEVKEDRRIAELAGSPGLQDRFACRKDARSTAVVSFFVIWSLV
jgi:hypothetical protein